MAALPGMVAVQFCVRAVGAVPVPWRDAGRRAGGGDAGRCGYWRGAGVAVLPKAGKGVQETDRQSGPCAGGADRGAVLAGAGGAIQPVRAGIRNPVHGLTGGCLDPELFREHGCGGGGTDAVRAAPGRDGVGRGAGEEGAEPVERAVVGEEGGRGGGEFGGVAGEGLGIRGWSQEKGFCTLGDEWRTKMDPRP